MNEHIVVINPQQPKTGLLDVIQSFLERDGLKTIQRRIILIEHETAFMMEGKASKPIKKELGKVPEQIREISGKCYIYKVEEIGEDEINIRNTINQLAVEYGSTFISQSATEALSCEMLFK